MHTCVKFDDMIFSFSLHSYLNARKERLKTQREKKVKQAERREVRQVDLALEADLARMQRQERAEGIDSPHVSGSDRFRPRRGTQHPSEPDVELHSSDDEIQLLYPQGSVKPTESSSRSEDASMSKSKRRRERRSRTVKIQGLFSSHLFFLSLSHLSYLLILNGYWFWIEL